MKKQFSKRFAKQLSWLLAFVLFFTNLGPGIIITYASDTVTIDEDTNKTFITGKRVSLKESNADMSIDYYESADSVDSIYTQNADNYTTIAIGPENMGIMSYKWHLTCVNKTVGSHTDGENDHYSFKAYPVNDLNDIPQDTQLVLPAGAAITTTTSAAINVCIGDTFITNYEETSDFTLPTISELVSMVGETSLSSAFNTADYHIPDLNNVYYTVDFSGKDSSPYSLKLTLVPTVTVTFNANTGTLDSPKATMYATQNVAVDHTKLPSASNEANDVDFYGWKYPSSNYFISKSKNPTPKLQLSSATELKAMYKERIPTFKLDLENHMVTNLLANRTYEYPKYDWSTDSDTSIPTDSDGVFYYMNLFRFEYYSKLCLLPDNNSISIKSDPAILRHNTPNPPTTQNTATTASVTNNDELIGCQFAIQATDDNGALEWDTTSTFTGLAPETEYKVYVKHAADENGFESYFNESAAFTTLSQKTVSDADPNGVTIEDIADQSYTGSSIEPSLVVKDSDKLLTLDTDYTVAYSDNTNVGTATATISFKNDYRGSMTKAFKIVKFHRISFDANGGSGSILDESIPDGTSYTLPACSFTPPAKKQFKTWTINGTDYSAGASYSVTSDITLTAIWQDLDQVKAPAISPNGSSFKDSQIITLTSETSDAIIYYTTDGSEPSASSTVYSKPFTIDSTMTIKAIAIKEGMLDSSVTSADFTKQLPPDIVNAPTISPNGCTFKDSQTITLTSETKDAIIYFTTDGSVPSAASTRYTNPFTIDSTMTIKAIAVKEGMLDSSVTSAVFTKQLPPDIVKAPVISPNGGKFSGSTAITLSSETKDATIYYTTDGSEPTAASTVYSKPFKINRSTTVKAIAVKAGMTSSTVTSASFTKKSSSSGSSSSSGGSSSSSGSSSGNSGSTTPSSSTPSTAGSKIIIQNNGGTLNVSVNGDPSTSTQPDKPLVIQTKDITLTIAPSTLKQILSANPGASAITLSLPEITAAQLKDIQFKITADGQLAMVGGAQQMLAISLENPNANQNDHTNIIFNEPLLITIDLSKISIKDSQKLTLVKYEQQNDGSYKTIKLGGTYDKATGKFTGHISDQGIYGIAEADDLIKVNLQIGNLTNTVNDMPQNNDVAPQIINSTTFVPLRFIAESLGAKVKWNAQNKKVTIVLDDQTIELGSDQGMVIQNSRTLVPIRYISENLGAHVLWIPSIKSIEIVK